MLPAWSGARRCRDHHPMICFDCGMEYRWVYRDGRLMPINSADDLAHWASCRAFRQRGKAMRKKSDRVPETRFTAKTTGSHYRPSCGQCSIPPWEVCACSFKQEPSTAERINQEADERLQAALFEDAT